MRFYYAISMAKSPQISERNMWKIGSSAPKLNHLWDSIAALAVESRLLIRMSNDKHVIPDTPLFVGSWDITKFV